MVINSVHTVDDNFGRSDMATGTIFEGYIDKLVQLHELMAKAVPDEDDGGDGLREDLFDLDKMLTEEERKWVNHLSGDLYMIYGEDMYRLVPDGEIEAHKKLLLEQVKNHEWLNVLYTVQDSLGLPKYQVALYRGMAWAEKSSKVSLLFLKYANQLLPST